MRLGRFRSTAPSFADLLSYAALVADGVLLQKDGSLMAAWYYAAPDGESATPQERNELSRRVNAVLAGLGSGWMIQAQAIRVPSTTYPDEARSFFPDPVSRAIDKERRQHFETARPYFETRHALVLTWREPDQHSHRLGRHLFSGSTGGQQTPADATLARFTAAITEFEQYLSSVVSLRRMRARPASTDGGSTALYDDLLQFVRFCITGQNHPMRLPAVPMYLDGVLSAEFRHGFEPSIEGRSLAIVTIEGFPAQSWPGILDSLAALPLAYRWSSRFICLEADEARRRLEHARRKWSQKVRPFFDQLFQTNSRAIDQDAMLMVAETESAIAAASSQLVVYGYYTSVIQLIGDDAERLREQAELVRQAVQAEGFVARIETLNATEAYLGSLPGNWYANIRGPLIHTGNLADLMPLSSPWAGHEFSPCPYYPANSPPLMQVGSGSTPFRLNLHEDDVGHTLVFGPTGTGKSTLLALIAAQFLRYRGAQVFAFDKGSSMLPMTLGVGGAHYRPGDSDLTFAPLADLDTSASRAWAADWLEALLALQGVQATPDQRNAIARQLELMAAQPQRSLSDFVAGVQSREIKAALAYYSVDGGPMGSLLDAKSDGLDLSHFQTFEMEELMALGERHVVPVLLYLFRRIEQRLSGAPSLIILDEAWLMLGHGLFRARIREWLKVLRKANCAVILATQSISDAQSSGMIDVLRESCPTKILLANAAAREPGIIQFYESFGLNDQQLDIVATARPKRDYYVISPSGRRLFEMDLGPISLSFSGVGSRPQLNRVRELAAQYGTQWPRYWLGERGVSHDDWI